jgi:hypothetical protein
MNRIDNSGQGLAKLGRDEDKYMAHVAPNEMVVPPVISPETRALIEAEMKAVGLDPNEYTVGEGMSINPITGMPEFGWLKKTFKSVKKVVKKAAPVIGVASMFIPGLGPAISGALGGLGSSVVTGLSKIPGIGGALSSGASALGRGIGALTGMGGGAAGATGGATSGNLFSRIRSGIGSYFNPAEGTPGIFGGSIGPSLRRGIGSFFGGGMGNMPGMPGSMPSGQQEGFYNASYTPSASDIDDLFTSGKLKYVEGYDGLPGHLESADGTKFNSVDEYFASQQAQQSPGGLAGFLGNFFGSGKSPLQFLSSKLLPQSVEDALGTGPGGGGLFGGGSQGGGGLGGMLGGNMGAAGIAALLGKTVYDAAKERQGGLAATPAVTMDALGRYSLANALGTGGTREEFGLGPAPSSLKFNMGGPVNRQYFNQGGAAIKELDMRNGGESAGPGTGTSDDIPAMLSDGEFVMTAKATRGAGAFGMNKTKSGIELVKGGKASREKGVENMRELMNIFEAI